MNRKQRRESSTLDRAIEALRAQEPAPGHLEAAASRVWERVSRELAVDERHEEGRPLRSCGEFQSLMPDARSNRLSPGLRLLLEDHTRECVPCRKAWHRVDADGPAAEEPAASLWRGGSLGGAVAAGLAAVLAAAGVWFLTGVGLSQDNLAQVLSVDGALYHLEPESRERLVPGDWISGGEEVRTAKGSGAVLRLADGSTVEVNERTALELRQNRSGARIRLHRGSLIVEASDQGSGHLGVSTEELLVAVQGTIFSVRHGAKGSRVSVVEGAVTVARGRDEKTLYPGDQLGTRAASLSFEEELAWSRHTERYLELLAEFTDLRRDLNQLLAANPPRHSTRLLDLAPDSTVVYAALPNLTFTVSQGYSLLRERVSTNPRLEAWWQDEVEASGLGGRVDAIVEQLRAVGESLGEELVVTLSYPVQHDLEAVMVLAEVTNPLALEAALENHFAELEGEAGVSLRLVEDPFATAASGGEILVWIAPDVLVATPSLARMQGVARLLEGGVNPFVGTGFHAELAEAYAGGTALLAGVDLARLLPELMAVGDGDVAVLELSGFLDVEYLLVEQRPENERFQTEASLSFSGPRRGLAGWLAEPGPMGALDFVSSEATFVSAAVVEEPASLLEQLLALGRQTGEDFEAELDRVESGIGLRLEELVAPLGGEFAVALDGPALPTPAWKLIVEVYDEGGLQQALEAVWTGVAEVSEGRLEVELESEEVGGRTFYIVRVKGSDADATFPLPGVEAHYTYHAGYLVACPTRALVERAIQLQMSGSSIVNAAAFQDLLPSDGYLDFSAVAFSRLGEVVEGLLGGVSLEGLSAEQRQLLTELQGGAEPSLHVVYGEADRIRFSGNTPGLQSLLGLGPLMGLSRIVHEVEAVAHEEAR